MDELRFNKVFAGFLCAGLLIMAGVQIAHVLVPDQQLAENSYFIEVPEATEVADAVPQDTGPEPILALLASADVAAGEKLAKKCTACHQIAADGKNMIGPNLWGVIGRNSGSISDYKYSKAMIAHGKEWSFEEMNSYLIKPQAHIKGTKMAFAGLRKEKDRASVILYMNSKSDSPKPTP